MHADELDQDQDEHRLYHPYSSRHRSSLTRALPLLLVFWLAASGCAAGQASAVATQAPTHTASPTATRGVPPTPVGERLGPFPTQCAVVPPPQIFTMASGFGGGFGDPATFTGGGPAWELGLGSPLQAGQLSQDNPYPSFKVMWIVGPNVTQPVTLTGHEMQTGAPLWFEIYPSNAEPISSQTQSVYSRSIRCAPYSIRVPPTAAAQTTPRATGRSGASASSRWQPAATSLTSSGQRAGGTRCSPPVRRRGVGAAGSVTFPK